MGNVVPECGSACTRAPIVLSKAGTPREGWVKSLDPSAEGVGEQVQAHMSMELSSCCGPSVAMASSSAGRQPNFLLLVLGCIDAEFCA